MNPIRFRAWDKIRKKLGKVVAMDWDHYDNIVTAHIKYYDGTVMKTYPEDTYGDQMVFMQDTGLLDKNGKEIYAGDIIRFLWGSISFNAEVILHRAAYVLKNQNTSELNILRSEHIDLLLREVGDCEIIGDVYQNPELLEVE